ncbi:MAG TPA: class I SAM-dependent methyltransferase [Candidatus Limnocylindrales bacterium]|nr:class I SAM-dependent methyltransferase [Candidatus Limnocylindrales bacterium]
MTSPEQREALLEARWCTLCGPGAAKKELYPARFADGDLSAPVFSARRSPDGCHFRLVECAGCGMIFSDPACPPETLGELYAASDVTYGPQEQQIYDSYAPILDRAASRLARRGAFVEIGGGSGFMLKYAAPAGFSSALEIEPSADAERRFVAPSPHARFVRSMMTDALLPESSASLICFFQMLDHLPDPLAFLKAVWRALEPGGVAVCVTHDTSGLATRLLGESSPIFDIEHTYLFNHDNLSRLFSAAGFDRIETFAVANDYSIRYWLGLAPLPAAPKGALLRTLELAGVADRRLRLRLGNVGAIARKPQHD